MSVQFAGVCCLWACWSGPARRSRSLLLALSLVAPSCPFTHARTFPPLSLSLSPFFSFSWSLAPSHSLLLLRPPPSTCCIRLLGFPARVKGDICGTAPSVNLGLIGLRYRCSYTRNIGEGHEREGRTGCRWWRGSMRAPRKISVNRFTSKLRRCVPES